MNPWTAVGILGELAVILWLFSKFEQRGYKRGYLDAYRDGFNVGRAFAAAPDKPPDKPPDPHLDWWLKAEHDVNRTRQTMQDEERWP